MPEEIERQEMLDVSEGMIRYGGSFCVLLGKMLVLADAENVKKIKATWPEYWKRYLDMGRTTRMAKEG